MTQQTSNQRTLTTGEFAFMVAALTGGQACGTLLVVAMPTIAPAIAASYGVPAYMIGYQASLVYVACWPDCRWAPT